ncbi:unnamed protein product [Bemisia tabaci]|uniref:Uncharacterized protein n=1 Tax=Bemisia tabaci TaxID=7038 RepID=A0A9P0A064_BEMTA|nr:unnamed protein product [Bemisia tabaci]
MAWRGAATNGVMHRDLRVPGRIGSARSRPARGRGSRGGSRGRPVKTVQIIRKVEYSSSLREEDPPIDESSSPDEPKKKCILLIVKKNKDDALPKRPRMTVEPTLQPLLPAPAPSPPSTQRKGRYVKVRKEALQALPELRELIQFHRSKHAELYQENQLYDQKLALFGEGSSIQPMVTATPSKQFRPPPPPTPLPLPSPPTLPKGPGYLLALRQENEWNTPPSNHRAPPFRHPPPPTPSRAVQREHLSARKLEGFVYEGAPPEFPRLPAFEVHSPSVLDYESVTVLDGDYSEAPPADSVGDSRAKKVLEEFDFLVSPEPQESDETGYEPNCSELDFASLEIVRGVGEDISPEPQDPFLEIFQICKRQTCDPFQQPTTFNSGSDARGSRVGSYLF